MLRSLDGQFVHGIVVDHGRNCVKWLAKLSQDVTVVPMDDFHMHKVMTAPAK